MNDYVFASFYWTVGGFYWPWVYRYWPVGFSIGLDEGRIYVVPSENRELILEEGQRIFVVPGENREYVATS